MTFLETLGRGALELIEVVEPRLTPVVELVKRIADNGDAVAPVVQAAIKGGEAGFAAAQAADPQLAEHLRQLAVAVFRLPADAVPAAGQLEHVTGMLLGGDVFKQSLFTPQDPRFNRANAADS